ncbi:hypothetical protein DY78_GL001147 [Lactiplantibacillus fabifermentans DSM 21115]|uniref:Uncharacterized protein n=1 Tax=Lactiplantibacillus fabifermentans DSM 21115 TaxID=1413187 RepID=A0A0R2NMT0_9LACO|nr:hypothetical protein DY78_GL001147 [Lactiplantibacillus fabifermentans DSM 21115]
MMTFIYAIIGLILVTFSLMTGWHLTVQSFGNILLVLLLLLLFGTNCQYYFLCINTTAPSQIA